MSRRLISPVEGTFELPELLPRYVFALALSSGMTLTTCFSVFKWKNVRTDAGHGTMFMVFFCWFIWSFASLCRTFVVFTNTKMEDSLEIPAIRYLTIVTEVFFDAISMWFMVATYEFQRRALSPRTDRSHRACLRWYLLIIGGITLSLLFALVAIEHAGTTVVGHDEFDPDEAQALTALILAKLSWVSWGVRCLSVIYPVCIALWLHLRRDRLRMVGLPRALTLIVLFYFILNAPYLIIDTMDTQGRLHLTNERRTILRGLTKTVSYLSGVAISIVMGCAIRGFDSFYHARRSFLSKSIDTSQSVYVMSPAGSQSPQ
ncbi:hypothetical protein AeMF1_004786 [Aphanomyces euteiches]|nr:hypothetical protein AeMF1_004786 [Aphanomyces euteiches]KAH9186163.1 hypothetical protein AeNC1_011864 [Aphanomyces euteiches]